MSGDAQPIATLDNHLTVHETAQELRLDDYTVRAMCRDRRISAARVGNRSRIPVAEIRRLIEPTP